MTQAVETETDMPPMVANIDEVGDSIEIARGGLVVATVNNFYDFPCVDDETLLEEIHADAVATAHKFVASDALLHLADIGYQLSTWAASINWDARGSNTVEWLEGLKQRIELYQGAHKMTLARVVGEKCYQCDQVKVYDGEFCDDCMKRNAEESPERIY